MSLLSQFFPSAGTGIPVEMMGIAGGGGGGTGGAIAVPFGGSSPACTLCRICLTDGNNGGAGGFFHAYKNYTLQPGTTYCIVIGAGGAGGTNFPVTRGSSGTKTCIDNPANPISVEGGGGGGTYVPFNTPGYLDISSGYPGGTGGGNAAAYCVRSVINGSPIICVNRESDGLYYTSRSVVAVLGSAPPGASCAFITNAKSLETDWGCYSGYPGSCSCCVPSPYGTGVNSGYGGNVGWDNTTLVDRACGGGNYNPISGISSTIYGSCSTAEYKGAGGYWGSADPSVDGFNGQSGVLIVKWASPFGAAPPTGFPGASDISPQTPGYYTYCFTSSGSITLP
jgi:hypothetical protein